MARFSRVGRFVLRMLCALAFLVSIVAVGLVGYVTTVFVKLAVYGFDIHFCLDNLL